MADGGGKHWLFHEVQDIFPYMDEKRSKGDTGEYTGCRISVFVFHEGKLLLLQQTGVGWTVPNSVVPVLRYEQRTIAKCVIDLLRDPIEDRTLDDIQFIDLALPGMDSNVVKSSATEIHISVLLSVGKSSLRHQDAIIPPATYQALQWVVDAAATGPLGLDNGQRGHINAAFQKYGDIAARHTEYGNGEQPAAQLYRMCRDLCKLARLIRIARKRGAGVDHLMVATQEGDQTQGLFLMEVEEIWSRHYRDGEISQIVIPARPREGDGRYPEEKLKIVGNFQAGNWVMAEDVDLGVMLEDDVRVRIAWSPSTTQDRRIFFM